ncbi:MAG: hypothetical protein H6740_08210 [Alphaproteobacteria bacterium]|nr:hypothetical protein [Alphaproteobacteria bacterium]
MPEAVRSRAPLALLAAALNGGAFLALMAVTPAAADNSPPPAEPEATETEVKPEAADAEAAASDASDAEATADAAPSTSAKPPTLEPLIIDNAAVTPLPDPTIEEVEEEEDSLILDMLPSLDFGGY